MMKKLCVALLLLAGISLANAQHLSNPFFAPNGTVRLETQELIESSDSLSTVYHRGDDVIWMRTVYRIIDMRYKQNYCLYFPTNLDDPQYHSLFDVMVKSIAGEAPYVNREKGEEPLHVYKKPEIADIKPYFDEPLADSTIQSIFEIDNGDGSTMDPILVYDPATDKLTVDAFSYTNFVRNQLKWMIQEVVFFDKHYSRLYSKIIAIAPMYSKSMSPGSVEKADYLLNGLWNSIMFWVNYDEFRKFMARQYVIPQSNDVRRVTYEQFFAQKQYTSYLIGDCDSYSRIFAQYAEKVAFSSDYSRAKLKASAGAAVEEEEAAEEEEEVAEENAEEDEFNEEEEEAAEDEVVEEEVASAGAVDPVLESIIEKELKREQQRVQDELLNFEQDLWEY